MGRRMILSEERDPRLTTIRRGGTLTDAHHRLLALWAADCAAHVVPLYEAAHPGDERVRHTVEMARAWGRGELGMKAARQQSFAAQAARATTGAAKFAGLSASQAVVVSHVAAHDLGAAAYAIRAARAAAAQDGADETEADDAGRRECAWQRAQLPEAVRDLVLDDQHKRNHLCWFVFD